MTDDLAHARHDPSRIEYLDGLRGVGALSVVLFHFVALLVPHLGTQAMRETSWALRGPMLLLTNGPFYVQVFFVLSGYVVANSLAAGRRSLVVNVISRYLRLTIPMTATLILTWIIGVSLPQMQGTPHLPSLLIAIERGVWGVYLHGAPQANFVLWTMPFEFFGSLAIYFVYQLSPRHRVSALLVLSTLFLLRVNGLAFAVGTILREMHHADRLRPSTKWAFASAAAYLYFCCNGTFGIGGLPNGSLLLLARHEFLQAIFFTAGAAGLIYLLITIPRFQRSLRTPLCQFLAHLSFGLYLVHFPLMSPFVRLYPLLAGPTAFRIVTLLAAFVATSLALGWLFTKLIDDPLVLALKRWRRGWIARLTLEALLPAKAKPEPAMIILEASEVGQS